MLKMSLKKAHKFVGDLRRVPMPSPSMVIFPQNIESVSDVKDKAKQYEDLYVEYVENGLALNNIVAKVRAEIATANMNTKTGDGKSILDLMAEIAKVRSLMDRLSMFSVKAKRTVDNNVTVYDSIMSTKNSEYGHASNVHMSGTAYISEEVCNAFFKQHKELTEQHDTLRDTLTALNSNTEITINLDEAELKLLESFGLI